METIIIGIILSSLFNVLEKPREYKAYKDSILQNSLEFSICMWLLQKGLHFPNLLDVRIHIPMSLLPLRIY